MAQCWPFITVYWVDVDAFSPRYYMWVKAMDQVRPPALPVDVEALKQVNEKIDWRLWRKVLRSE